MKPSDRRYVWAWGTSSVTKEACGRALFTADWQNRENDQRRGLSTGYCAIHCTKVQGDSLKEFLGLERGGR